MGVVDIDEVSVLVPVVVGVVVGVVYWHPLKVPSQNPRIASFMAPATTSQVASSKTKPLMVHAMLESIESSYPVAMR